MRQIYLPDIILPLLILIATFLSSASAGIIHPDLVHKLGKAENANILVTLKNGNSPALKKFSSYSLQGSNLTRGERLAILKNLLQNHATVSQHKLAAFLRENNIMFRQLWISNQIIVEDATNDLVKHLAKFPEVEKIIKDGRVSIGNSAEDGHTHKDAERGAAEEVVWGLKIIEAESAWNITNGTGVVVGILDTGVRHTHEAIRDSFVGLENYGWYDPLEGREIPYDTVGHGTHVIGTVTGSKGIGVAPGAKWMTCQACPSYEKCDISGYLLCAQWILCPTMPDGSGEDCSKAPHVINNSWGKGRAENGETFFDQVTAAWRAAGIIPVFSIGNTGSWCYTAMYPEEMAEVIGVGATNSLDGLAGFSGRGPSSFPSFIIKPDLSAPGQNVTSALPESDTAYGELSGTSMASPHVAGVVALLLSIDEKMSFDQMKEVLISSVDTGVVPTNRTCHNITDTTFPNNMFGAGRLNARKAVEMAMAMNLRH